MRTMLDLYCGRGGWTNAFLDRGWKCLGIDIAKQPDYRGEFIQDDVTNVTPEFVRQFDFVCASPPCEQFSVCGLRNFFPDPKHPEMGITLFTYTRKVLESSNRRYVIENVRAAQPFVGQAKHHCGPFYLWGNAVPPLMPQGIKKGLKLTPGPDRKFWDPSWNSSKSKARLEARAKIATIPPELANCVADYAEKLLESQ